MEYKTLVLNPNFTPISMFPFPNGDVVIPAEDAVTRVINGTCNVVEEYDHVIKTQNPNFVMKWPSVIVRVTKEIVNNNVSLNDEFIYYRDHGICMYCETSIPLRSMTRDHVIPKSKGGSNGWDNIVSACGRCNSAKANHMPVGQWRPLYKPFLPTYWQVLKNRRKFPIIMKDASWVPFFPTWEGEVIVKGQVA